MFHRLKNKSCLDVFVRLYAHGMIPELQETRDSIGNQFIQFCRLRNLAVGREAKRRKRKTQPLLGKERALKMHEANVTAGEERRWQTVFSFIVQKLAAMIEEERKESC